MGKQDLVEGFKARSYQIVRNLKSWKSYEWFIFFILIPLTLFLIFILPQTVKDNYLVFSTSDLFRIQTYILSEYTHSTFDHIAGNLKFYLLSLLAIFAFEDNKRRFWIMAVTALFIVPVFASLLTIIFWNFLGKSTVSQGFSGINAAFFAYALMVFIVWNLHDVLPVFEHPNIFTGWKKVVYYVITGMLAVVLALTVSVGLQQGVFVPEPTFVSNGIAHFGGFIAGLLVFLFYDLTSEKRNTYFDSVFCMAIIMGIIVYIPYLMNVINAVKRA